MGIIDKMLSAIRRYDMRYDGMARVGVGRNNGYSGGFIPGDSSLKFIKGSMIPVYPDTNIETYWKGYTGSATVYSVVHMMSRKFGIVPRYVYKVKDKKASKQYKAITKGTLSTTGAILNARVIHTKAYDDEIATDGPAKELNDILIRPNPLEGQDAFYLRAYVSYKITGEVFEWLNRGDITDMTDEQADATPPVERWILPAKFVEIVPDPSELYGILGYTVQINGQLYPIRKNDVIHWKTFNPDEDYATNNHLRGMSPFKPGNKVVQQDNDATDAMVAMYQNGGARGLLFEKSLKNIGVTQKAQLEEIVQRRINNNELKGAIATLQGDWGYHAIGADAVDLELIEGSQLAFDRVCNLVGCPPGLFKTDQTYENINSDRKRLLTETILPDCCSFRDEEARILLPAFGLGGDYTMDIDHSELPELQEDMAKMVEYLSKMPITPNEFRKVLKWDELKQEGMDVAYQDSGKKEIGKEDDIAVGGFGNENDFQ
jgi:phage portal protein BeeE